jgi:hypothetical protein
MTQELKPIKGHGWLWFLGVVVIIVAISYSPIRKAIQEEAKASRTMTSKQQPREAIQLKKIEVIVYPDRYTEIPLPYYHWFDFGYKEDFRVRLANGKEFDFKVGRPEPFLGNEIPASRLELKSLAGKEVVITIFLRPKN